MKKLFLILALVCTATIVTADNKTWQKADSEYSKIDDNCTSIQGVGGYMEKHCKGKGVYDYYQIATMDHGDGLVVKYKNKTVHADYWASWHAHQPIIEWRFHYENGKKVYHALINRLVLSSFDEEDKKKDRHILVVFRLDKEKSCLLGGIEQTKNMNIKARQLADNKLAKCEKMLKENSF